MAPNAGDALLKAAEAADSRELVALYGRHVRRAPRRSGLAPRALLTRRRRAQASRSDSYSFDELAQTLSKKLKPRLSAALLAQARHHPQLLRPARAAHAAPLAHRRPTTRCAHCTLRPRRQRTAALRPATRRCDPFAPLRIPLRPFLTRPPLLALRPGRRGRRRGALRRDGAGGRAGRRQRGRRGAC